LPISLVHPPNAAPRSLSQPALERKEPALPVDVPNTQPKETRLELDDDTVDAEVLHVTRGRAQVRAAGLAQGAPLPVVDLLETLAPACGSARLDLDEDESLAVERDQIDLTAARADVAREDSQALANEKTCGDTLAASTDAIA
jgi:hypothetical protein